MSGVAEADHRIRAWDDITEVSAAEWDSFLDPGDLQASHRFIRLCQRSGVEEARYRHLMVYQGEDLAAVASLSRMEVSLELLAPPPIRAAVERLRRLRPRLLRVLVCFCGLPVSFGQSCFRVRPGVPAGPVAALVAAELERWGRDVGAGLFCFKEFPEAEANALGLERLGYVRAASLPFWWLPIRWGSFEGYAGEMRAGYRRQLQATLDVARREHLTLTWLDDFGSLCERLHALYGEVMDRAENRMERLNLDFFRRLNHDLGGQAAALLVHQGDRLLASAVVLFAGRTVTFLLAGIDYERHRATRAYQVLVAAIVEEAIRRGAERLELGQTSSALKSRFGAVPAARSLFLKGRSPILHQLLARGTSLLFPQPEVPVRRVFRA